MDLASIFLTCLKVKFMVMGVCGLLCHFFCWVSCAFPHLRGMAGGPGFGGDKVSAVSPWVSPDLSCSHQGLWSTSMVFPGCQVGSSIPCQSRFAAVLVRILPALLRAGRGWSSTELRLRVQGPCETRPARSTMPPEKGSHTLGSQLKTWFTPMQNAASINQGAVTRCLPWS